MKTFADDEIEILPPVSEADTASLQQLERVAKLLDSRWTIPGTGIRFGADALMGLIPGAGDLAAAALSAWIIYHGHRHGASKALLGRMIANVALDTVVGSVPVAGSIFDVFYKANNRNVRLLRRHLRQKHGLPPDD